MPAKIRALVVILGAAMLLSGCTSETPPQPSPGSFDNVTSTPDNLDVLPEGVPNVAQPLDVTKYMPAPCDVLTDQQVLAYLGDVVPGKPDAANLVGSECSWARLDGTSTSIHILLPKQEKGLAAIYTGSASFFLPLEPINNYPIVAFGIGDDRPRGRCHTALGISNTAFMDVVFHVKQDEIGKVDSCAVAREIAGTIILNVQGNR